MTLNSSIHYREQRLYVDGFSVSDIVEQVGTPVYIYSLKRALSNYARLKAAFSDLNAHIHYSAKANANLAVLRALVQAGAGVDTVSAGEIRRALAASAHPQDIVFAGVGKTLDEIRYAVEQGVGWFNIENVEECRYINEAAEGQTIRVALRLNPEVTANTHPYIATGHGAAKFGLTAETIQHLLAHQDDYPHLEFAGIHLHIGSQLGDTDATQQAVQKALELIEPYPTIRTVNMGGGIPVSYKIGEEIPSLDDFVAMLKPLLKDYSVLLEPGRSIIADAGVLVTQILYVKQQAGQTFYITDASMSELIRPALYRTYHEVVPVYKRLDAPELLANIAGPVCETTDMLAHDRMLPEMQSRDLLAILTTGAYGMVMASQYNARPRPPEVIVDADADRWHVVRRRETWDDLIASEMALLK